MRSRLDSLWLGLTIGIIFPVLTFVMFYYSSFTKVPLKFFIEYSAQIQALPKLISICVIPNLGAFFLFIWRSHYYSARGVIMATVIMALLVLALKIFT